MQNDTLRGYFLAVDGTAQPAQFYKCVIDNLCAGANLTFSMWGISMTKVPRYYDADLKMLIELPDGTLLVEKQVTLKNMQGYWEQFLLNFTLPAGQDKVIFKIINNSGQTKGNDFALDDIEVRLCMPPVTIMAKDTVCIGSSTTFEGVFTNDGTFNEPFEYRWLYSPTGNLTSQEDWVIIGSSQNLTLSNLTSSQTGFYRLAVAGAGGIDNENCRAMSDLFPLTVKECDVTTTTAHLSALTEMVCQGSMVHIFADIQAATDMQPPLVCQWQTSSDAVTWSVASDWQICTADKIEDVQLDIFITELTYFRLVIKEQAAVYPSDYHVFSDTLMIVVMPSYIKTNSISGCNFVQFGDSIYHESTVVTDSLVTVSGCDSVIVTEITVMPYKITWKEPLIGCDSVEFDGKLYFETINLFDTLQTVLGCDSVVIQPIVVHSSVFKEYWISACGSFVWKGNVYNESVDVIDSLKTRFGCDSVVMCHITIRHPEFREITIEGCDTVMYKDKIYHQNTLVIDTLKTSFGCDSILTVHIVVHQSSYTEVTLRGETSLTYNDIVYTANTDLNEYLKSVNGCDSTVLVHIRIGNIDLPSDSVDLIVNKYNWIVLCNNVKARKLVQNPRRIYYQWYKDGVLLRNAIDDYYTEDREMEGCFFLKIQIVTDDAKMYHFNSKTLCIKKQEMSLTPNPVAAGAPFVVDYSFAEGEKENVKLEIYNSVGIKVLSSISSTYPLSVYGGLPSGIYYVKLLVGEDKAIINKLIVR